MNARTQIFVLTTVVILMIGLGCSNGQPMIPSPNDSSGLTGANETSNSYSPSQTHLWGFYNVAINPDSREVTIVPNRQVMFTANVVNFLNGSTSNLGFKLNEVLVKTDYTDVDIDVTLKHPFPGMSRYNGYDVRGVFMGDGSSSLNTGLVNVAQQGTDQFMFPDPVGGNGGPDGYTRWYNFTEFSTGGLPLFQYTQGKVASPGFAGTATLNPYKYFADGLDVNDDLWAFLNIDPTLHGVFSSGVANTRNYYLRFPASKGIEFGYAVIANWKDVKPEAHPSNAPETVACSVINNSDVYFVDQSSKGGNLKFDISLWNWGAQLSTGSMEEHKIIVESSVLSNPYVSTTTDMTPVAGDSNYSTYHVEIPADNVNGINNNEYWVIVQEKDWDYTNPFGIANLAEGQLSAYFRYPLTVSDHANECPTPVPIDIAPNSATNDGPVTCTITCSNLMGATGLSAYLDKSGALDGIYNIIGTDIRNVDVAAGTFDVTFELIGAHIGMFHVIVTNSCGETGASDDAIFEIKENLVGDIYVSNHHDFDGLPEEGTMEHPFHTVQAGLNAGQPNDLILVDYGLGIYPEHVSLNGGDRYIILRAYNWHSPSGRPSIDGTPVAYDSPSFKLSSVNHMTIQGFKFGFGGIDPGWSCMVEADGCTDITFRDCYFTGDVPDMTHTLVEAIQIYWTTDCVVENCLFKNINTGNIPGVWPNDTVQNYAIGGGWNVNLEIKQSEFTDIQNQLPDGTWARVVAIHLDFDWGAMNVHNNLIHHLLKNSSNLTTWVSVSGIVNNSPLERAAPGNGTGTIDHNTIDSTSIIGFPDNYNSGGMGIDSYNASTPTFDCNIDVNSNIITNWTGSANQRIYGIADNMQSDFCDIWNVVNGSIPSPWRNSTDEGVSNTYEDPLYENNTSEPYDYHLQAGSPAIGSGKAGTDQGCYAGLDPDFDVIGLLGPED